MIIPIWHGGPPAGGCGAVDGADDMKISSVVSEAPGQEMQHIIRAPAGSAQKFI
jgi:hypothetical protein